MITIKRITPLVIGIMIVFGLIAYVVVNHHGI